MKLIAQNHSWIRFGLTIFSKSVICCVLPFVLFTHRKINKIPIKRRLYTGLNSAYDFFGKGAVMFFALLLLLAFSSKVGAQCPETISSQPVSQTTGIGCTVTFSVVAMGNPTLTYQWRKGGADIPGATSSGYTISPVSSTDAGDYDVIIGSTDCAVTISSVIATLTVNAALSPGGHNIDPVSACIGYNPPQLDINSPPASGGLTPYTYQWFENGNPVGNSSSYDPPDLLVAGTNNYYATVTDGCGTSANTTVKTITIVADPVISITGAGDVCQKGNIQLSSTISGGIGAYNYTWASSPNGTGNWTIVASGSGLSTYTPLTTVSGVTYYRVTLEPNIVSCNNSSDVVSVTVLPSTGVTNFTAGATTVCQNAANEIYTATAENSTSITYSVSPTAAGIINPSNGIMDWDAAFSGTAMIMATSKGLCGETSAILTVTVEPSTGTTVFTGGATTVCQNAVDETYSASSSNSTSIAYSVSPTGAGTINSVTGVMNWDAAFSGTATITATATGLCGTTSADRLVTVNPSTGSTTFTSGATTVCQNAANETYTATASNSTSIAYSVSPVAAGIINPSTGVMNWDAAFSGTSTITAAATGLCGTTSADRVVTVIAPTIPTVTISANPGGNICAGTSVTFTATPGNAGTNPYYQWKKNGSDIPGANSSTFTSSTLANTDRITVVITSDAPCPASATSNEILMTVNALQTPTVTITESANPICQGASVTFSAIAISGGSSPSYQWQVNGVPSGSSPIFSTSSLADNDQVNLVLISSATCAINPATSNTVTMLINPVLIPSVTISASETTICPGTQVTFTATPTNGGTSPSYQWKLNGGDVGTNSSTFSSSTLSNGNIVSVVLTSNATCASPVTAISNSISMNVNPATPSTPGTITGLTMVCPDASGITYSIATVTNATAYNWTVPVGWSITGGQNSTTITVTAGTNGQNGNITVSAGNSCGTSSPGILAVTVGSLSSLPTGVSITNNNTCSGTSKTLTVTGGSLGTGATWQWFTGSCGGTAAGTGASIVVNPASGTNTTYYVRASGTCNTTLCAEGMVVVSPGAPGQPGTMTGTTPVCPGITGLIYSITAVPDATSYTWTVPSGWSITAGAGTNSITVTSGGAGQNGNISVTASNSCGISSPGTLAVTVNPGTPATPGIISGAAEQCINKTGLIYSIAAVPNATSYAWTLPSGWTITSGAGTTSITVSTGGGAVSGNLTVAASNSCGTSGTQSLTVIANSAIPLSPATPTGPTSICDIASGLVFTVPVVANATSYNWQLPSGWNITAGSGTNEITVVLTAGAQNGDQNITVTAGNSCGTSAPSAILTVAVGSFATADAGIDQTICFNTANITVNGSPGGAANKNKGTWSTSGTGAFGDATKPGPTTYTPSTADKTAGSVTLTFTTDNPAGLCDAASDFLILTIRPMPIASISGTTSICSGTSSTITFNATPNTIVSYTISGVAGTSTINIGAGGTAVLTTTLSSSTTYNLVSVAYTVTPTCSQAVSGSATVTVNQIATVNAGADQTVCSLSPDVTLAGSIGGSATSGTWSGGAGTFNPNNTTLNAVYNPTAAEIAAGTVSLTLTTDDPAGPCPAASDQVVISINPAATANAGTDQTICMDSGVTLAGAVGGGASSGTWSGGTGSFTPNANTFNAVYTPGVTEIAAGSVTLTLTSNDPAGPCTPAADQVLITINPKATANAGPDQTICAGSTFLLAGTVGGGASTGNWSGGAGIFNPDNTTMNAIYTPTAAEIAAGSLTLTLTTNDPTGPCPAASDQVLLTINPNPTANAGNDQAICAGSTVTLTGSIGGSASSGSWSGGTGSFSPNQNTLNVVYTPGAADIAAGTVILTLTTNDPSGVCTAVSDQVVVTINPLATVSAGPDQTICSNTSATMAGSFGGGATSGTWSTNKNGTFSNNSPSAIYTPGNSDINSGSVTLTYTTNDPAGPCGQVSSSMALIIKKAVVITDQPLNTGVCESKWAEFSVGAIGDALIYQWYKGLKPGGTILLNSSNITGAQSTTLHFNQVSLADDGPYYVMVSGASPCSPVISNQVTLNVDKAITITTQPAAKTVCTGANVIFSVVADANGDPLTYQWFKGIVASGTPVSDSGTISGALTATLTINNAAPGDAGNYYAVITGLPGYTCAFVYSAVALLTITPNVATPVFASGTTSTRCQGAGIVTYSATASNSTGITYGLDATSTGAGNSVNTSTGAVTFVGTWSGTSIITVTATGCNGPTNATHTVTVNPTVGIPAAPTPSNTTICQGSTSTTYTTSATDATSYTWNVTGTGNTISGTGTTATVTWAAGFSGSATISVVANGCNGPSAPATTMVSVTPTVGVPTAPSPSNTTICQAGAPTTYTTSASNATSYTWSITGSGNLITGTGTSATVTWGAGFTGSATVSVQANGCNGSSVSASSTVTVTPTVLTPVFGLGATSTRCQGTGSVTYTATATNTTGITYTLDAASITGGNSIVATTGAVTYAAGWSGTTTITASAAGCNGPVTATHTVNINPTSNGGTISPALTTICSGSSTGNLTLVGFTGTINRWESSTNGGLTWSPISNTSNSQTYSTTQTTIYRVVVQSGTCPSVYSSTALVSVIPPFTPIVTATSTTICSGGSTILTATSGSPIGAFSGGGFDQANPGGWCRDKQCIGDYLPARRDNEINGPWGETNGGRIFSGIEYNSNDGKFAIVNDIEASLLETPIFSLIGMPAALLTLRQAYSLNASSVAKIELSLDGGTTYNVVLATYIGSSGNYTGFNPVSLDLSNYLGLSNLRLRFNFSGTTGSSWALDNVTVPGTLPIITYTWNPTTALTPSTGSPVTANPSITTTYTVTTTIGGCPGGSQSITITVKQLPVITAMASTVCSGDVFVVTPVNGTNGTVLPGTTYSWPMPTVTGGLTGGAASSGTLSSITGTLTNPTNTAQTATYTVTPTASNCPGNPFIVTVTVNPKPAITAMTTNVCSRVGFTVIPVNGTDGIVPIGTVLSWPVPTVTGGLTGGAASSDIPTSITGTLTNPTNTAQTATYTVTPIGPNCTGGTFQLLVTVDPTPIIPNQISTICSGTSPDFTPANNSPITIIPAGTTYTWTNPVATGGVTGGSAQATPQTSINQILINPTNTVQTATYTVTPIGPNCTGSTFQLVVTVNPKPVIPAQTAMICSGSTFTVSPANGVPAGATIVPSGTTYTWGAPTVTGGITGGGALSGQTSISQTLINPTNVVQTATYTVTPTSGAAGACAGEIFTVTVTVNPLPVTSPIYHQ